MLLTIDSILMRSISDNAFKPQIAAYYYGYPKFDIWISIFNIILGYP